MSNLTLGSLFDGSGGFPLAGMMAGITPIWASEIEPFPIRVTTKRIPQMKHYGDISKMNGGKIEPVDIITFGSPCQNLSLAGKREGLNGEKSSMFFEAIRVIKEMRENTNGEYPRWIVWENVPGAMSSSKGQDFRTVLEEICKIKDETVHIPMPEKKWTTAGEIVEMISVAYRILDAQYFGVPQRRRRIFLVADFAGRSAGKIHLTRKACLGILRRAKERGRPLPPQLHAALLVQAGLASQDESGLTGTPGLAAGFFRRSGGQRGQHRVLGARGAHPRRPATSGNRMPSVLCLNDQGGSVMDCTEDKTGTLRAQQHGHQPLVFENHGIDSRYTGPHPIVPTLSARAGTGGNNLPLALQPEPTMCICGNAIDRQPRNGGNGIGIQNDVAYTLTSADRHAIFRRQRVDKFREDDTASTQSARQGKDATDLICQPSRDTLAVFLIRRLTPLECERLQGFPDGWTDLPGASDSARYKALGNSVPVPCVEYIMAGIARAAEGGVTIVAYACFPANLVAVGDGYLPPGSIYLR